MDIEVIQKVALWAEERFAHRGELGRGEIVAEAERASSAELPEEARNAIRALPEGSYDASAIVSRVGALLGDGQAGQAAAVVTTSTGFEGPGPQR